MTDCDVENFVRERDEAFIAFVMENDFAPVARYMRKYKIGIGENLKRPRDVLKASIYKAVRHCTNIPDEVKREAEVKCALLVFDPRMSFERDELNFRPSIDAGHYCVLA